MLRSLGVSRDALRRLDLLQTRGMRLRAGTPPISETGKLRFRLVFEKLRLEIKHGGSSPWHEEAEEAEAVGSP